MTYGFHLGQFHGCGIFKLRNSMPFATITQQIQGD